MTQDTCDHCRLPFAWEGKPICPSCGAENVRTQIQIAQVRESAMLAPAREKAIAPAHEIKRPSRATAVSKKAKKKGRR